MNGPMDTLKLYPVRKTKKQKMFFRADVLTYLEGIGYSAVVETGSFGVRNVVAGDPEKARYLITAHYDTCASLPFPNLITPCSLPLFLAWQLLLVILMCVPAGFVGGMIGGITDSSQLGVLIAYCLLLLELVWMLFGPANRHNSNDNTSGVVAVLETAAALPPELRDQVCFVLFDLEEGGLLGSASYRKNHRKASAKQTVLNLDCVGEGDEILLFPTKKMKKDSKRISAIKELCSVSDQKSISVKDHGFSMYPSDQANFPTGFGIAALCRSKWGSLYLGKIHTGRDRILDERNIAVLRDFLIRIVREKA